MSPETIVSVGSNYPNDIIIESVEETPGNWAGKLYFLKDLLVDTEPKFKTSDAAEKYLHDFSEWCVKYVKDNEVHELE